MAYQPPGTRALRHGECRGRATATGTVEYWGGGGTPATSMVCTTGATVGLPVAVTAPPEPVATKESHVRIAGRVAIFTINGETVVLKSETAWRLAFRFLRVH